MRVNYPGLKKEYAKIKQSYANRGMDLENLLNETNQYYLEKDIAVIYKKPTPIGINKVRYENNKQIIKEAYFKTQSTLDYNGIYKGYYVDFDAKETTSKTAFPLSNIHEHQLKFMKRFEQQGGVSFLLIYFTTRNEFYYLPYRVLAEYVERISRDGHAKNFKYEELDPKYFIHSEGAALVHYLEAVNTDLMERG